MHRITQEKLEACVHVWWMARSTQCMNPVRISGDSAKMSDRWASCQHLPNLRSRHWHLQLSPVFQIARSQRAGAEQKHGSAQTGDDAIDSLHHKLEDSIISTMRKTWTRLARQQRTTMIWIMVLIPCSIHWSTGWGQVISFFRMDCTYNGQATTWSGSAARWRKSPSGLSRLYPTFKMP
jgi:hypothetical protein